MKEYLCQHSAGSDEPQSLLAKHPKGLITSLQNKAGPALLEPSYTASLYAD